MDSGVDQRLAREAKSLVALAFRNGPIEGVHAGKRCPTCAGDPGYSKITDAEMKTIMKSAVNRLYTLLLFRQENPAVYEDLLQAGDPYTRAWDAPEWESPL